MNHRFSLGKITTQCPQCGRRTFKPYIDNATGLPLDASACGRCNREVNCRYHLTPSAWFAAGGRAPAVPPGWKPPPLPPPDYIAAPPQQAVEHLRRNTLYQYLCGVFGEERVLAIFRRYHVAHSYWNGGATAFFLADAGGHFRSAKLMRYGTDGHRLKGDNPAFNVTWLHTLLRLKPFNFRACFFGEHLAAADPEKTLIVVESEKTALIMACDDRLDKHVYLACGGASAIVPRPELLTDPYGRLAPLKGRDVILFPDADMVQRWTEAANALTAWCRTVRIVDITAPPYSLTGSQDIADHIVGKLIPK